MQYKTLPLGNIADIRTIQLFRDSSPEHDEDGNACAVSIRDLVASGPLNMASLVRINLTSEQTENCLKYNDILMPARGDRYPARLFDLHEEKVIPIGQINVISALKSVNGVYLAWYLNRKHVQQTLISMLTGSNIKSLNKSRLLSIQISLPERHVQETIANIQSIHARKMVLHNELMELEKLEIATVCENFLKLGI